MNNEKIALLVDSGTDLPQSYVEKPFVFLVPLKIIYKEHQYRDRVDITGEEVTARLSEEIPKTSLPDGNEIMAIAEKIVAEGYNRVIVVTISAGLSGTFNALRVMFHQEFPDLQVAMLDTKNIGIGAGVQGIYATELIEKGESFDTIVEKIEASIKKSKVYFSVATLEYLQKGGRIGLVASILGQALSLKPVISCNDEGVYYTVTKSRGLVKSRAKLVTLAKEQIGANDHFRVAIAHAGAKKAAEELLQTMHIAYPNIHIDIAPISPALTVHTGPGLLGIAVQLF